MLVGITGGIACGKSEVGRILLADGVPVCEADALAHNELAPGGAAYADVVNFFGKDILNANGSINRAALGEKVFRDDEARATLNALVHPGVRRAWQAWGRRQREAGNDAAVIVPLLFEVGADKDVDAVICVVADTVLMRQRMRERGWTDEQMDLRLAAQWPVEKKRKRTNHVIVNNGSVQELISETRRVWQSLVVKEK